MSVWEETGKGEVEFSPLSENLNILLSTWQDVIMCATAGDVVAGCRYRRSSRSLSGRRWRTCTICDAATIRHSYHDDGRQRRSAGRPRRSRRGE